MMAIVCLDTQIIQWGMIKRASDPKSQPLIARAGAFLSWLDKQKVDVILPSLIVAELLVPVPYQDHNDVLTKLATNWLVVDFDLRAARLFAQMRYDQAITSLSRVWCK